jgi:hypothetical protein
VHRCTPATNLLPQSRALLQWRNELVTKGSRFNPPLDHTKDNTDMINRHISCYADSLAFKLSMFPLLSLTRRKDHFEHDRVRTLRATNRWNSSTVVARSDERFAPAKRTGSPRYPSRSGTRFASNETFDGANRTISVIMRSGTTLPASRESELQYRNTN